MNLPTSADTRAAVAVARDRHAISNRYAALAPDQRNQFRARLGEMGIDAGQLPIVPLLERDADGSARGPLSAMQKQLWFLAQLDGDSSAYHMSGGLQLDGELDRQRLLASVAGLCQRHETLRTRIVEHAGEPQQQIEPFSPALLQTLCEFHDLRDSTGVAAPAAVEGLAQAFALRRFDLAQGPLWRLALVTVGEARHVLLLCLHHVIADGFSMSVLVGDFARGYAELAPAPQLSVQFADYLQWLQDWRNPAAAKADLDYWCRRLGEPLEPLPLPLDRPRGESRSGHGARVLRRLADADLARLREVIKTRRSTLSALLLAAYQLLLARHSGEPTVRVGMPLANRDRSEASELVACLVNTVVIEARLAGCMPFSQLLGQVQQRLGEALAHGATAFAEVVQALRPPLLPGVTPLFQAMFNLLEVRGAGLPTLPGLTVAEWHAEHPVARHDLTLDIRDDGDRLNMAFIYATDIFDAATVERMADDYLALLQQVLLDSERPLGRFVLDHSAPPTRHWPAPAFVALVDRLFDQARRQPEAIAVTAGAVHLDYQQLSQAVQRLAGRLQQGGTGREERVGVCVQRSAALPVALYGVLASGAAYVPLDPEYPAERLRYILADAGIRRVVIDAESQQRHADVLAHVECVDLDQPGAAAPWQPVSTHPEQLAYVIYTSGSTGQPKGVGVTQHNVARLLDVTLAPFAFDRNDVWSCFHSYSFDFSVWEVFGALSSGGRALIVPYWLARSPEQFLRLAQASGVTVLNQTPSAFLPLIQAEQDLQAPLSSLRLVIFGGEKLLPQTLAGWLAGRGPSAPRLVNMYGITETTVHVTARDIGPDDTQGLAPSLIGEGLADLRLYVLDADLNPAPCGVFGELCVAGAGLARGYLGQPGLTASRFVADPFGPPGARLYRSGDVARRLRNGELEYLGRNDGQVKIRGFRIEPGEIRAALLEHPQVRSAVVQARPDPQGGLRLVAWLVGSELPSTAVRAFLATRLPAHMVPAAYVWLAQLPLTVNGKLDLRALPEPAELAAERVHVAAASPAEQAVAAIWQEVLGGPLPGLDDDFFERGGHSLSAVKVITRVRERLQCDIALQQVFNLPTLRQFAAALQSPQAPLASDATAILPRARQAGYTASSELPLSLAQERLWVLWQLEPLSAAYHVPGAVRLSGAVQAERVRLAFAGVVARHESLRTRFVLVDGQPRQRIDSLADFHWRVVQYDAGDPCALGDALRQWVGEPFDLAQGPLLRVMLLSSSPSEHVLAVVMHHIVADGWSMNLLIDEFCTGHEALRQGREPSWPALPIQCADHAVWERSQTQRQAFDLQWWQATLGDEQPVLALPLARPRPELRSSAGGRCIGEFDAQRTQALRRLAQSAGSSLFSTLLAAYQALLHRYSGQQDVRIGIPVANRERLEVENLIGFFTNTLVIRSQVHGAEPFAQLLAATRNQVLEAQAHASVPFAQLVDALQPQRELGLSPLFQTLFNLQVTPPGQFASLGDLRVSHLEGSALGGETAQFDLTLDITDNGDTLRVAFGYASDVLERATVETLARHYDELLGQVLANPQRPIAALTLTTPVASVAAVSYPYLSVPARFGAQALAAPAAQALACAGSPAWSYAQLSAQAARIAAELRAAGVAAEARVGLCVSRSPAMVAALLGIWQAGGAFVPLDPEYPSERLAYILDDAAIAHVLVDRESAARLASLLAGVTLHILEDLGNPGQSGAAVGQEPLRLPADALAYVMYTSGSTGAPKGVAMTHGALAVHVDDIVARFAISARDRVLQFSTINFDAAMEQLLPALCVGAAVVLRGPQLWSWPEFNAVLEEQQVSVLDLPTAFWQQWLRDLPMRLPALRLVTVGGEALSAQALARWQASGLGGVRFDNTYGPTEAAISVMSRQTRAADCEGAVVTLGRAYPGRMIEVLDAWGNPMPDGAAGELCIGGAALARGYLGRAAATAERFVPDPYGPPGSRLYRTGDLCRVRVGDRERVIDYLGRGDRQVKLRGYRIELADVEQAVRGLPQVSEALALVQGQGEGRRLYAYAVVGEAPISGAELLTQLAEHLPAYSLPSVLVALPALPLTANGKVDRQALPMPELAAPSGARLDPRDQREAELLAIWREVLGHSEIGVSDNFFALGGDSIQAIQAVSRARALGMTLSVRDLFAHQTVAALARQVPQANALQQYAEVNGAVPLTPIQHWFFSEHPEGPGHWNQSVLLAADQALAEAPLAEALHAVMSRHDALRVRYQRETTGAEHSTPHWQAHAQPAQRSVEPLPVHDLRAEPDGSAALAAFGERLQASLDIQHGPLWRAALVLVPGGASRLLLVVHHLAVDGVSWRILLQELAQAWAQAAAGQAVSLPPQRLSWGQWCQALAEHGRSAAVRAELAHWQEQLAPTREWHSERAARGGLPLSDHPEHVERTLALSRQLRCQLDREQTRALLHSATETRGCRVEELLLGALAQAVCGWSDIDGVLLELEGHGREEVIEGLDLTATVGWFTSRYPLWLSHQANLDDAVTAARESLRAVPHKGVNYGVLESLADPQTRAAIAQLPRAQISFNYLGQIGDSQQDDSQRQRPLRIATGEHVGAAAAASTRCSYALEINALIIDGELLVDWRYLPSLIAASVAQTLLQAWRESLLALLAPPQNGPLDFASDVQGEDLDALLGLMDD